MQEKIEEVRINELTEQIVLKYLAMMNQSTESVACVDIEGLACEYFKQTLLYEAFAEDDPDKDAFTANGIKPLKVRRNRKIESIVFPKDTIVLDRFYQNPSNIISRRYILSHELGHKIYEKIAPGHDVGNYHSIFDTERVYSIDELKEQMSVPESQATRVGCALLMPRFLVENTLYRVTRRKRFNVFGGHQILPEDSIKFKQMADDLGVTFNMLMIRMRRLRLLNYRSIEEYLNIVGLEGGGY